MRVGSIELPDELVEAHAEGRLVLFVGAGASVAEPTCLPNYRELAERVAAQSEHHVCEASLDQPDKVLGTLKSAGVDVHKRVHDLISNPPDRPAPEPNALHQAIGSLALASPPVRIVTTNYDRCLSDCLPEGVDEYVAHALPEQAEFTGLVYLHGSAGLPAERLIVTKEDLGRHYLVHHAATRFLDLMFQNLSVLFIGYSLNDTLMSYLVEGMPSEQFYVLTDEPLATKWNELGTIPVGYERHDELPGIVQEWADLCRMSMLDHQQRVGRIVAGSPPWTPSDDSYLHSIVSDTRRRGLFIDKARGLDWLHWIRSEPSFEALLDPSAPPEHIDLGLAQWFADYYAASEDCTTEALSLVINRGGTLNSRLWMTVSHSLTRKSGTRSDAMNRWLPLLVETMPRSHPQDHVRVLLRLLEGCDFERDRAAVVLVLDRVLEPALEIRHGQDPGAVVPLCPNSSAERWFNNIKPYISALALDLVPIVDRHLRKAYCLQRAIHSRTAQYDSATVQLMAQLGQDVSHVTDREFFDSVNHRRKAIESHSRNDMPCGLDLLIDVAREVLELILEQSPAIAYGYLDSWVRAESALLRRLGIHGWCERTDMTADAKLEWLRNGDWIGDRDVHHEVMRLIAVAVPSASEGRLSALIEDASSDATSRKELRLLGWIAKHAPESAAGQRAFRAARAAHPQWEMPHDADFRDGHIWSDFSPSMPIVEWPDLHKIIERGPSEAVALLLRCADADDGGESRWFLAVDAVRATVKEHADDGISLLEEIAGDPGADVAAVQSIVETVFMALNRLDVSVGQIGRLQTVLPKLWEIGLERFDHESHVVSPERWIDAAVNHWSGNLMELWIAMIAAQWQNAGERWRGLDNTTSAALKQLLDDGGKPSHYAQTIAAHNTSFLYRADRTWFRNNLMCRFDSESHPDQAFRFWDALLASRLPSDDLLQDGLLDYFVGFSCQVASLTGELEDSDESIRSSYVRMAAAMCLQSQINPLEHGWLMQWIARIGLEGRCEWVRNVGWMLSGMSTDAADVHWSRWIKNYWHRRVDSIPLALRPDESSVMAEWTVLSKAGFKEAVELVTCTEGGFVENSRIPTAIVTCAGTDGEAASLDHIALEPLAVRDLFAHLLSNSETTAENDGPWNIMDAVERLDRVLEEAEMKPILNEMLRLGHEEFVSWLQSRDRTQLDHSLPVRSPPG
jgi:hypothetical protein